MEECHDQDYQKSKYLTVQEDMDDDEATTLLSSLASELTLELTVISLRGFSMMFTAETPASPPASPPPPITTTVFSLLSFVS